VAVTIAIAIAVALWMSGLVGSFTQVENLEIVSAYAESSDNGWNIYLSVKNVGTTDATIDNIFINGKPASSYNGITVSTDNQQINFSSGGAVPLPTGQTKDITITITSTSLLSGQMVEIKLHTASGKEHPKQIILP